MSKKYIYQGREFEYCIATMKKGKNLEYSVDYPVRKYEDAIFFMRNKDGVNGWHCGSLPLNDYRIEKLTIIDEDDERLSDYL